jgi:predicted DNA-binding transcriptional regulator AlpA
MPLVQIATQGMWTHRQTAEFLNISASQLYVLNSSGRGPKSFKVGGLRRYDPAEVRVWLQEQCRDGAA